MSEHLDGIVELSRHTTIPIALGDAQRAAADVWATTCLLASAAPEGRAVAAHLVDTARHQTERLYADRAPFDCKDALKSGEAIAGCPRGGHGG